MATDDYALDRLLAGGRFGKVYLGHGKLERDVAVKLIERVRDADSLLHEARKLASVPDHEHVVGVHHAGIWSDGRPFIVMDYCPGGSLEDLASRPVDPATACRYLGELCRGLDHVHQHDLLHLDLRPANVLIGSDRKVKLVDFGLSKYVSDSEVNDWYQPHAAPELIETGKGSRASDVYAAGMTLAHLLTGGTICRPFPTGADLVDASANGDWPRLAALGLNVPSRLRRVIAVSTDYDEGKRPQSARELKDLVDRAAPAVSFEADGSGGWISTDGEWRIVVAGSSRTGSCVEILRRGRRRNDLRKEGLTPAQAQRRAAQMMNQLSYP